MHSKLLISFFIFLCVCNRISKSSSLLDLEGIYETEDKSRNETQVLETSTSISLSSSDASNTTESTEVFNELDITSTTDPPTTEKAEVTTKLVLHESSTETMARPRRQDPLRRYVPRHRVEPPSPKKYTPSSTLFDMCPPLEMTCPVCSVSQNHLYEYICHYPVVLKVLILSPPETDSSGRMCGKLGKLSVHGTTGSKKFRSLLRFSVKDTCGCQLKVSQHYFLLTNISEFTKQGRVYSKVSLSDQSLLVPVDQHTEPDILKELASCSSEQRTGRIPNAQEPQEPLYTDSPYNPLHVPPNFQPIPHDPSQLQVLSYDSTQRVSSRSARVPYVPNYVPPANYLPPSQQNLYFPPPLSQPSAAQYSSAQVSFGTYPSFPPMPPLTPFPPIKPMPNLPPIQQMPPFRPFPSLNQQNIQNVPPPSFYIPPLVYNPVQPGVQKTISYSSTNQGHQVNVHANVQYHSTPQPNPSEILSINGEDRSNPAPSIPQGHKISEYMPNNIPPNNVPNIPMMPTYPPQYSQNSAQQYLNSSSSFSSSFSSTTSEQPGQSYTPALTNCLQLPQTCPCCVPYNETVFREAYCNSKYAFLSTVTFPDHLSRQSASGNDDGTGPCLNVRAQLLHDISKTVDKYNLYQSVSLLLPVNCRCFPDLKHPAIVLFLGFDDKQPTPPQTQFNQHHDLFLLSAPSDTTLPHCPNYQAPAVHDEVKSDDFSHPHVRYSSNSYPDSPYPIIQNPITVPSSAPEIVEYPLMPSKTMEPDTIENYLVSRPKPAPNFNIQIPHHEPAAYQESTSPSTLQQSYEAVTYSSTPQSKPYEAQNYPLPGQPQPLEDANYSPPSQQSYEAVTYPSPPQSKSYQAESYPLPAQPQPYEEANYYPSPSQQSHPSPPQSKPHQPENYQLPSQPQPLEEANYPSPSQQPYEAVTYPSPPQSQPHPPENYPLPNQPQPLEKANFPSPYQQSYESVTYSPPSESKPYQAENYPLVKPNFPSPSQQPYESATHPSPPQTKPYHAENYSLPAQAQLYEAPAATTYIQEYEAGVCPANVVQSCPYSYVKYEASHVPHYCASPFAIIVELQGPGLRRPYYTFPRISIKTTSSEAEKTVVVSVSSLPPLSCSQRSVKVLKNIGTQQDKFREGSTIPILLVSNCNFYFTRMNKINRLLLYSSTTPNYIPNEGIQITENIHIVHLDPHQPLPSCIVSRPIYISPARYPQPSIQYPQRKQEYPPSPAPPANQPVPPQYHPRPEIPSPPSVTNEQPHYNLQPHEPILPINTPSPPYMNTPPPAAYRPFNYAQYPSYPENKPLVYEPPPLYKNAIHTTTPAPNRPSEYVPSEYKSPPLYEKPYIPPLPTNRQVPPYARPQVYKPSPPLYVHPQRPTQPPTYISPDPYAYTMAQNPSFTTCPKPEQLLSCPTFKEALPLNFHQLYCMSKFAMVVAVGVDTDAKHITENGKSIVLPFLKSKRSTLAYKYDDSTYSYNVTVTRGKTAERRINNDAYASYRTPAVCQRESVLGLYDVSPERTAHEVLFNLDLYVPLSCDFSAFDVSPAYGILMSLQPPNLSDHILLSQEFAFFPLPEGKLTLPTCIYPPITPTYEDASYRVTKYVPPDLNGQRMEASCTNDSCGTCSFVKRGNGFNVPCDMQFAALVEIIETSAELNIAPSLDIHHHKSKEGIIGTILHVKSIVPEKHFAKPTSYESHPTTHYSDNVKCRYAKMRVVQDLSPYSTYPTRGKEITLIIPENCNCHLFDVDSGFAVLLTKFPVLSNFIMSITGDLSTVACLPSGSVTITTCPTTAHANWLYNTPNAENPTKPQFSYSLSYAQNPESYSHLPNQHNRYTVKHPPTPAQYVPPATHSATLLPYVPPPTPLPYVPPSAPLTHISPHATLSYGPTPTPLPYVLTPAPLPYVPTPAPLPYVPQTVPLQYVPPPTDLPYIQTPTLLPYVPPPIPASYSQTSEAYAPAPSSEQYAYTAPPYVPAVNPYSPKAEPPAPFAPAQNPNAPKADSSVPYDPAQNPYSPKSEPYAPAPILEPYVSTPEPYMPQPISYEPVPSPHLPAREQYAYSIPESYYSTPNPYKIVPDQYNAIQTQYATSIPYTHKQTFASESYPSPQVPDVSKSASEQYPNHYAYAAKTPEAPANVYAYATTPNYYVPTVKNFSVGSIRVSPVPEHPPICTNHEKVTQQDCPVCEEIRCIKPEVYCNSKLAVIARPSGVYTDEVEQSSGNIISLYEISSHKAAQRAVANIIYKLPKHCSCPMLEENRFVVVLIEDEMSLKTPIIVHLDEGDYVYSTFSGRVTLPACTSDHPRTGNMPEEIILPTILDSELPDIQQTSICPGMDHSCPKCESVDDNELKNLVCASDNAILVSLDAASPNGSTNLWEREQVTITQHIGQNYSIGIEIKPKNYENRCILPEEPGDCNSMTTRYHYDTNEEVCYAFDYSGCNGNANNFQTEEECEETCMKHDNCYKGSFHIHKIVEGSSKDQYETFQYVLPEQCNCPQLKKGEMGYLLFNTSSSEVKTPTQLNQNYHFIRLSYDQQNTEIVCDGGLTVTNYEETDSNNITATYNVTENSVSELASEGTLSTTSTTTKKTSRWFG